MPFKSGPLQPKLNVVAPSNNNIEMPSVQIRPRGPGPALVGDPSNPGYIDELNEHLLAAATNGKLEEVRSLVQQGANVNAKNSRGYTALHFACKREKRELIEFLVGQGADVNAKTLDGKTPLHVLYYNGSDPTVGRKKALIQFLQQHGAVKGGGKKTRRQKKKHTRKH